MLRKAAFILRLAGQDLKGNIGVHLVGAAIIASAFLTLGLFLLVAANLQKLARVWEEKIQLCVYVQDGLDPAAAAALQARLAAYPGVTSLEFTSKEQALVDFKRMLGAEAGLVAGLDENPLPASFVVRLAPGSRGLTEIRRMAVAFGAFPGVEEVDFGEPWLESWNSALRLARAATLLVGGLIVLAVVFIISNTIRLTMYSRKDEIGIMRVVGASNLIIRLPFILEGMLQGGGAALFGVAALWLLYFAGGRGLQLPGLLAGFVPVFLDRDTVWLLFGAGMFLGAAGSLSRLHDFFRV